MTPRFGPVKDLIALGSVVRRDTREPEEFAASSKNAIDWLTMLLRYESL
jgi:hypothetical protein